MRLFARVSVSCLFNRPLFTALLLGSACFANPVYSVQSLGTLGSQASLLGGMDSSGTAAGTYTNIAGNLTPATFSATGVSTLAGIGYASGINSSGTVIGTTFSGSSSTVTEWTGGQAKSLGISGYGQAINDAGQVGGAYTTSSGNLHAFIESGTTVRDLGTLSGNWSAVAALNSSGQAAGASSFGSAFHGFFWDGNSMRDVGTLGGANSYATGINNKGQVVGSAQTSLGYLNAFLWSSSGIVDLGTLGGSTSAAYGVNDSGEVVGYSETTGNSATHAFLEVGGVMLDLNSLLPVGSGWTITGAYGIDNLGDILATATSNGANYAVELKQTSPAGVATPEPAAMALAGLGLITVACVRKRSIRVPVRN